MNIRQVDIVCLFPCAFRAHYSFASSLVTYPSDPRFMSDGLKWLLRTRAPAWIVSANRYSTCSGRLVVPRHGSRLGTWVSNVVFDARWKIKPTVKSPRPTKRKCHRGKAGPSLAPHTVNRLPGELHRLVTGTAVADDTCRCYGSRRPVLTLLRFASPSPPLHVAHDDPAGVLRAVCAHKTPCCYFQFTRVPCRVVRVPSCERLTRPNRSRRTTVLIKTLALKSQPPGHTAEKRVPATRMSTWILPAKSVRELILWHGFGRHGSSSPEPARFGLVVPPDNAAVLRAFGYRPTPGT